MTTIKELDPIQGLLDYVLDVKPYHTKVAQVLIEYVHQESMVVTMAEDFELQVQFEFPSLLSLEANRIAAALGAGNSDASLEGELGTFGGITPYGSPGAWPVISFNENAVGPFDSSALGYDSVNNLVVLPGDRTVEYTEDAAIEVTIYDINGVVLDATQYTVASSTFVLPNSTAENQHTVIELPGLVDPTTITNLPLTQLYVTVTLTPFPIANVITGYGTANTIEYTDVPPGASPLPTPGDQLANSTPNENNFDPVHVNSFVIAGDVSSIFVTGSVVEVVGDDRPFQILLSQFDGTNTFIRVVEPIPDGLSGTIRIRENLAGYDEVFSSSARSDGTLSANVVESISFSWSDPANADIIDGYQFLIQSTSGSSVTVNGPVVGVEPGDQVQILESPSNNGTYTVASVTATEIILTTSITAEVGGWIEKYEP